jgi:hypothetical protein
VVWSLRKIETNIRRPIRRDPRAPGIEDKS